MKIRSLTELQDKLDSEMGWRIKEISSMKSSISAVSPLSRPTLIRAGIALSYAHWEGFIKNTSEAYLAYLNAKKLSYDELQDCFVALGLRAEISRAKNQSDAGGAIGVVDFIRNKGQNRSNFSLKNAIDTRSNLNSEVFEAIVRALNLSVSSYETKYHFIDESLLMRRNKVAHGEFLDVDGEAWKEIADEVLKLLRQFKNDIENGASMELYKKVVI
jgi:MAE_28990/MAE_18760-like HEPN